MASNSLPPPDDRDAADSAGRMRSVAKYSGIAVQMFATIGLSAWAGIWLDGHFHTKTPWYTISLMLAGVFLALYQVIRGLTKGE